MLALVTVAGVASRGRLLGVDEALISMGPQSVGDGDCLGRDFDVAGATRTTVTPDPDPTDDVRFGELVATNAVVIRHVEGMTIDEATAWAVTRGWTQVLVVELPSNEVRTTDLDLQRFTIYHCGGEVTSAVVG